MKNRITKTMLILVMMMSSWAVFAQSPLAYLEQTYPQLTELYKEELSKYPAHYVFAVDVSGTMNKYSDVVTKAL